MYLKNIVGNLVWHELSCDTHDLETINDAENSMMGNLPMFMRIGFIDNEDSADNFYFRLEVSETLTDYTLREVLFIKHHTVYMSQYDYQSLVNFIKSIILSCSRSTWQESVDELTKYFQWEFEDYKP